MATKKVKQKTKNKKSKYYYTERELSSVKTKKELKELKKKEKERIKVGEKKEAFKRKYDEKQKHLGDPKFGEVAVQDVKKGWSEGKTAAWESAKIGKKVAAKDLRILGRGLAEPLVQTGNVAVGTGKAVTEAGRTVKDAVTGTKEKLRPTRERVRKYKEDQKFKAQDKIDQIKFKSEAKKREGFGIFGKKKADYEKDIYRLKNIEKGKAIPASQYKLRDSVIGRDISISDGVKDEKLLNKFERVKARRKWRKDTGGKVKKFFGEKAGKESWLRKHTDREHQLQYAKQALGATTRTVGRVGAATGAIGESIAGAAEHSIGPVQVFKLAFQRMSVTLKWLIIIVFLFVILFIPWGVFYYTGWAVAAAFMFLISLIYWVFVSFFNGIAYVLVSLINLITRVIMGILIFVAEAVLGIFMGSGQRWVPDPAWAARFRPTTIDGQLIEIPWDHPGFRGQTAGYAIEVSNSYWYEGRVLMEASLIRYDQIANIPALMMVSPPEWQSWMYNILIVKILEKIPGLSNVASAWDNIIGRGLSNAAANFVETAPPWLVVLLGCTPLIIIAIVLIYIYWKYKGEARLQASGF
jgi:hypothetical protein